MHKFAYTFFIIFLAAQADKITEKPETKAPIVPHSLYDQVLKKLDNLKEVVNIAVTTAVTHIKSSKVTYLNYADGISAQTRLEIEDESNKSEGQLDVIKNLAQTAGINIDACLRLEPKLESLQTSVLTKFQDCIQDVSNNVDQFINGTYSKIGEIGKRVRQLELDLKGCKHEGLTCLVPVVNQIDASVIEMPELLQTLVNDCYGYVKTLTPEVDQCSASGKSAYVTGASTILGQIEECANTLMK